MVMAVDGGWCAAMVDAGCWMMMRTTMMMAMAMLMIIVTMVDDG